MFEVLTANHPAPKNIETAKTEIIQDIFDELFCGVGFSFLSCRAAQMARDAPKIRTTKDENCVHFIPKGREGTYGASDKAPPKKERKIIIHTSLRNSFSAILIGAVRWSMLS